MTKNTSLHSHTLIHRIASRGILPLLILLLSAHSTLSPAQSDSEQLGKAMEYFQGAKYHEALLIFQRLDKRHRLSPRLKAYIGLCLYYEQEYAASCKYLDPLFPDLQGLAPHELSLYYFCAAESHFFQGEYADALPSYSSMLPLCYDNEKGDILFRMGFCHLQMEHNTEALTCFEQSLACYEQYGCPAEKSPRLVEIRNIIHGLKQ